MNISHYLSSPWLGFNSQPWQNISKDYSLADHTLPTRPEPARQKMAQYLPSKASHNLWTARRKAEVQPRTDDGWQNKINKWWAELIDLYSMHGSALFYDLHWQNLMSIEVWVFPLAISSTSCLNPSKHTVTSWWKSSQRMQKIWIVSWCGNAKGYQWLIKPCMGSSSERIEYELSLSLTRMAALPGQIFVFQ